MDKRALKILLDAFWSPNGWKPDASRGPSADDFDYAKSQGMMFDPVMLDHTHVQSHLTKSIQQLDRRRVADAFLASLSTRRLDWRSAFGSYVVFQRMPTHDESNIGGRCRICGMHMGQHQENLNVLNFERFKWGGVRHDQAAYAALDLSLFLQEPAPRPTPADIGVLRSVMDSIRSAPPETTAAGLQAHLAKSLKSNKAERDTLVALLGFSGILLTPGHTDYSDSFTASSNRHVPNRRFVDMPYPACWWVGSGGVNEARLDEYFGHVL